MQHRRADFDSLSRSGMIMLVACAMEVALGLVYLLGPFLIGGPAKFVMLMVFGGSIVLLFRFAMPGGLRILFAVLLTALMMLVAVRADIFGLNSVTESIGNAEVQAAAGGDAAGGRAIDPAASADPDSKTVNAVVRLSPADTGDGGWAERINGAAARDPAFGGVDDVRVSGFVTLRPAPPGKEVQIIWTVEMAGKSAPCGMLSLAADENELTIGQVVETFRHAAQRSSRSGGARCN